MSGLSVTVDDAAVLTALRSLQARCGDLRPAMDAIGQNLVTAADLTFRGQADPWGTPWAKLSQVTQERRRKGSGGGSNKILRDTGVLANSLNYQITADSVTFGTSVIYAPTHQFGAKMGEFGRYSQVSRRTKYKPGDFRRNAGTVKGFQIPWGDIPRRAFLPISKAGAADLPPDQLADILDTLNRHLLRTAT